MGQAPATGSHGSVRGNRRTGAKYLVRALSGAAHRIGQSVLPKTAVFPGTRERTQRRFERSTPGRELSARPGRRECHSPGRPLCRESRQRAGVESGRPARDRESLRRCSPEVRRAPGDSAEDALRLPNGPGAFYQPVARNKVQRPSTPFKLCWPRGSKVRPDPATRSVIGGSAALGSPGVDERQGQR